CMYELSTLQKIRISKKLANWKIQRKSLLFVKRKYIPWLYLSNRSVWISRGKKIFNYQRNNNIIAARPNVILQGRSNADVGNFQLKNDLLVSGQRDGSMWLNSLKDKKIIFDLRNCHNSDINSVDISQSGNIIVSGSRDNCLKIWKVDYDSLDVLQQSHNHILQDRLFFMESCKNRRPQRSSPIYSLSFDAEYLFTATDQNLNVLNFSVYNGNVNDYSICCR
ncbi:hypothetical protein NQ314_011447, partial [Rhamnusium bicolor]